MKKFSLLIFLFLIGAGICIGIYSIYSAWQNDDLKGYEKYSSSEFSLYYPENWDVLESNDSIIFANPNATYTSLNIQIVASKENGGIYTTINDVADGIERKLNDSTIGYKKISEKLTEMDGRKAIELECEFDYGINFSQIQIIVRNEKNENFYILTYTSLKENYRENLQHYMKAKEKFRFE